MVAIEITTPPLCLTPSQAHDFSRALFTCFESLALRN